MQKVQDTNKAVKNLVEAIKDNIRITLVNAQLGKQLDLDTPKLEKVLSLVLSSADAGFLKAHSNFEKTLKDILK
jgi:hypothetical protein